MTILESMQLPAPVLRLHEGVMVVREDLILGGSKARFLPLLFQHAEEVVYASPCQGGAQVGLAVTAKRLGKQATIFLAKRAVRHPRYAEAERHGAQMIEVSNGRLNVVTANADRYVKESPLTRMRPVMGLRFPAAHDVLVQTARSVNYEPDEVWCAAGSGMLASALKEAWPNAHVYAIAVGRDIPQEDAPGCEIIRYPRPFDFVPKFVAPFDCDPHYEKKAWEACRKMSKRKSGVLFWNMMGGPET